MRRRQFTQGALGLAALSGWRARAQSGVDLRELAAKRNLLVGSAVSYAELQRANFTALLAQEASIVVPENEMKWESIHPEPDRFDFHRGDALVSFAAQHEQQVRGHNLCWHQQLPRWFKRTVTADNAESILRNHIATVAGHYAGKLHSWDVVNEAIHVEDGRPDGLRKSPWLDLLGPRYLDIAFQTAAKADPHARLTYNDYDLEQDSPAFEAKRRAVLQLLTALLKRDVPVQALGVQAHLKATGKPIDWTGFHRLLDGVERLGLDVYVTELDVDDTALPSDTKQRDLQVASVYRDFLAAAMQHRSVKAVLTWGLIDSDTWLNHYHPRADGLPQRPLPFDSDLKPKAAFESMKEILGRPVTA